MSGEPSSLRAVRRRARDLTVARRRGAYAPLPDACPASADREGLLAALDAVLEFVPRGLTPRVYATIDEALAPVVDTARTTPDSFD